MIRTSLASILLVSTCQFVSGQPLLDPAIERGEILSSISEISRAYVARNPAPFERLYLENYASIRSKPVYNFREQLIAMMHADSLMLRAGKRLEFETLRYDAETPRITFHGRTALVNVAKQNHWQYRGQKCLTKTQSTELWVKPGDQWKIAAGHTTTVHCDPKPFHPLHSAVAAIQPKTRAPINTDLAAEREVRALIHVLVSGLASLEEPFERVLDRHVTENFTSTDAQGIVSGERGILSAIQVPMPNRAAGFRNQEDAVLVYGDAAVYSYRVRTALSGTQQCSIFFVRTPLGWKVAAAHLSKNAVD